MVDLQKRLTFRGMADGFSTILDAMETLGLNLTLVAKTIAHDIKYKFKETLNQILKKTSPQSVQELLDITMSFFETFGFEVEMNCSEDNLIICRMKGLTEEFTTIQYIQPLYFLALHLASEKNITHEGFRYVDKLSRLINL